MATPTTSEKNQYQEFNNFQTSFYTSIKNFDDFTKFEVKRHGYTLLNNMAKGFPNLALLIISLKGIGWSGPESPALLKALQRVKFVNAFSSGRIPQFIYFKQAEKQAKSTSKAKKTDLGYIFDSEIKTQICSILIIDSKTYEQLKFTHKIQFLGQQLNGEFMQKENLKKSKTSSKKKLKL